MSHTTTIKSVVLKDISALRQAVSQLQAEGVKCELVENVKPRMYYKDQHVACPYVLKLHDSPYDVGFDKQEDGTYVPVFDEFSGHVAKQIGAKRKIKQGEERAQHAIGNLLQKYAVNVATNQALSQGFIVESVTVDADMNIHLTLGGM